MPTFTLNGKSLVFFGGFKKHIGLYPAPKTDTTFKDELSVYVAGKGTIKFPLEKPIPFDLIRKIVIYRVQENLENSATK